VDGAGTTGERKKPKINRTDLRKAGDGTEPLGQIQKNCQYYQEITVEELKPGKKTKLTGNTAGQNTGDHRVKRHGGSLKEATKQEHWKQGSIKNKTGAAGSGRTWGKGNIRKVNIRLTQNWLESEGHQHWGKS